MAVHRLSLPEAYLELQVAKRRSFFVYQSDLGVLRRVEARLASERGPVIGSTTVTTGTGGRGSGGKYDPVGVDFLFVLVRRVDLGAELGVGVEGVKDSILTAIRLPTRCRRPMRLSSCCLSRG
jgi:hypothetical protein